MFFLFQGTKNIECILFLNLMDFVCILVDLKFGDEYSRFFFHE